MAETIQIIIIGIMALGGIFWQVSLIEKDNSVGPKRIYLPGILCSIIIIGVLIRGVIAWALDDSSYYEGWDLLSDVWKSLVLTFAFVGKAYIGPLFIAFSLCTVAYFLIEKGEFKTWVFVDSFLRWIFGDLAGWTRNCYVIGSFIIVLFGCLHDSFDWGIFN